MMKNSHKMIIQLELSKQDVKKIFDDLEDFLDSQDIDYKLMAYKRKKFVDYR